MVHLCDLRGELEQHRHEWKLEAVLCEGGLIASMQDQGILRGCKARKVTCASMCMHEWNGEGIVASIQGHEKCGCKARGSTCAGMCVHAGGRPAWPARAALRARARPARHARHRAAGRCRCHSRPSARSPAPGTTHSRHLIKVSLHKGSFFVEPICHMQGPHMHVAFAGGHISPAAGMLMLTYTPKVCHIVLT